MLSGPFRIDEIHRLTPFRLPRDHAVISTKTGALFWCAVYICMRTVVFLGAGASAAEGAPVQSAVFKSYFDALRSQPSDVVHEIDVELRTFFWSVFGIDVDADVPAHRYPTFEEALGILDLAVAQNQSLKGFSIENSASNSGRIRFLRHHLVMLLTRVINDSLITKRGIHERLVANLVSAGLIRSVDFITSNYDILADNALGGLHATADVTLDYGLEFANFYDAAPDWDRPKEPRLFLHKLHGSLNWLYCPTCNELRLTPYEKGAMRLVDDFNKAYCLTCHTIYAPVIVPPTFFKDMSYWFLQDVWQQAERTLRNADQIVFCGYSFPDADLHVKYLLKRSQLNRMSPQRFVVCNHYPGKDTSSQNDELGRFQRFLGDNVDYTALGFADFASNPAVILAPK
jgi:NAD-dependent SIR2 family protein deacetylase